MKRIGFLYEKTCDISLIKQAIHNAARGKTQRPYIAKVLENIDRYAELIKEMLETESVVLSPNKTTTIFDRSCDKQRVITVPKFFPDQILHWVIMLVLQPVITKGMYRYSCGSVPRRGGMGAKKFVERALQDEKVRYVAKLDISKFFNNVQPTILMQLFRRKIKDEKMLNLIEMVLTNGGNCLPIGYYTSQWFSNFYLEGFDHFIKETLGIRHYVRYVDDMVLFDTNKRKLRKAIAAMNEYLATLGLKLKDNYQVWKVNSRPIDFVGFRFYRNKTLLRKKIFFRLCRRVRKVEKTGFITVKQAQGLLSLIGWLKHINGLKFYKERIYKIAPRWKLKRIVSRHTKKSIFGGKNNGSKENKQYSGQQSFQQRKVVAVG